MMRYWKPVLKFTLWYALAMVVLNVLACAVFGGCANDSATIHGINFLSFFFAAVYSSTPKAIERAEYSAQDSKTFSLTLAIWTFILPIVIFLLGSLFVFAIGGGLTVMSDTVARWGNAGLTTDLGALISWVANAVFVYIVVYHSLTKYFRLSN